MASEDTDSVHITVGVLFTIGTVAKRKIHYIVTSMSVVGSNGGFPSFLTCEDQVYKMNIVL